MKALTKSLADRTYRLHLKNLALHLALGIALLTPFFVIRTPGQSQRSRFAAATLVDAVDTPKASNLERRLFDLINDERAKDGRTALLWSGQVAAIARFHSDDMAENAYFSHEDQQGNRLIKRVDRMGLNDWRDIGENISWSTGFEDPATRAVEGWMNSPGHRENILNPNYRESGIGIAVTTNGRYYFTQIFVRRK